MFGVFIFSLLYFGSSESHGATLADVLITMENQITLQICKKSIFKTLFIEPLSRDFLTSEA